jgi:hypothetical protein
MRSRHFRTVCSVMPSNRAIPALLHPWHANATIFARWTMRCGSLAERDHLSTALRTLLGRTNGRGGGQVGIPLSKCLNTGPCGQRHR